MLMIMFPQKVEKYIFRGTCIEQRKKPLNVDYIPEHYMRSRKKKFFS